MRSAVSEIDQPLRSQDGRLVLVADVVLDCQEDLVSSLGARHRQLSDAELVLAAYERWGEQCLAHLSGEFAFALADQRRGGVLLARDQLGSRPLVLHEGPGQVSFATTAMAVADLPGVGHELDEGRVAEWLAFVMNSEATFVRGTALLSQGHSVWVDERGSRRQRYWHLDPDRIVDLGSPEAHALALRAAMDQAVARRLPSHGEVGVLLSGGLDSTSVAATAARLLDPGPVRT
ncbi:MAG: asparagine synthetase B, partial [Candidatus Eremiobacteraeota bacterium]|nr:asparagine synthetase B [Candidatus Eremiobacteraeota bacterium]